MRSDLLRLATLLLPLIFIGCGDLPTAGPPLGLSSGGRLLSGECTRQSNGTYLCPPISSDPAEPENPCMTSAGSEDPESTTVQSCPPSGGDAPAPAPGGGNTGGGTPIGGGGGDGGGTPGTGKTLECPDFDPTCTQAIDDLQRDTIPPDDCADPNNTQWERVYCRSTLPDSTQLAKTEAALSKIEQRGEVCATLAQTGRALLASGKIRFYVYQAGDATGYGHPNTDIQIVQDVIARYNPALPAQDFEHILVHEIDHVLRLEHIDPPTNWHTPHTAQCGGL
jgi:hypothetical protein